MIFIVKDYHQRYQPNVQKLLFFILWKVSKHGVFSGPYFPAFGLNTEKYFVSLLIQSKCGKMRTRNNSVLGHFLRCDSYRLYKTRVMISTILNLVCFGFFVGYIVFVEAVTWRKNDFLKYFLKLTGKHLWWGFLLVELQA